MRLLSIVFMLLLGLTIAAAIQIIGALLVLALLCTPAAAAMQVSASARMITLLSVGLRDGRRWAAGSCSRSAARSRSAPT